MLKNKFIYGFTTGVLIPLFAYGIIWLFDKALVSGDSSIVTGNSQMMWTGFKPSTLYLMAICANLIPTSFANKRRMDEFIRGIMIPTVLFAFAWFFYFQTNYFG